MAHPRHYGRAGGSHGPQRSWHTRTHTQPRGHTLNLPPPMGRSAAAHQAMPEAPNVGTLQELADHCHASTKMREAVIAAAAYIEQHNDYRAPYCHTPADTDPYRLDQFMTDAYRLSRQLASRALGTGAEVRMIVPMWVHTVQQSVINDVVTLPVYDPAGTVWSAYAIAAIGRVPSLLMMSWDWAAAFPCATPDADTALADWDVESRVCTGTCDDSEATA